MVNALAEYATEHGWTASEFRLFNEHIMNTYGRRMADRPQILHQVQAETSPNGELMWVALCENGWILESFGLMDHHAPLMPIVQKWLSGDES